MSGASSSHAPHRASRRRFLIQLILVAALFSGAVLHQRRVLSQIGFNVRLFEQKLRIPSGQALRVLTLGFNNIYADLMFIRSIQAYGAGWLKPGESREPVYDYFDKVSDVDPHFIPLYKFGNLLLADLGHDGPRGQAILKKGLYKNPGNWELAYLGVYNAVWMLNDPDEGKWFVRMVKRYPSTPGYVIRMEEYIDRNLGQFESALALTLDFEIRYARDGNDFERRILRNRYVEIADGWYRREIKAGMRRYYDKYGKYPIAMEELLASDVFPPFPALILDDFTELVDAVAYSNLNQDQAVDAALQRVVRPIDGLPPDPRGYWYYLSELTFREFGIEKTDPETRGDAVFDYLFSTGEVLEQMNNVAMEGQRFVLSYMSEYDGEKPSQSEMAHLLNPDWIGGHWVYDREENIFFSTAQVRLNERTDPRIGAKGRGPFPLPLFPTLNDFPEDRDWAAKEGWIVKDGRVMRRMDEDRDDSLKQPKGPATPEPSPGEEPAGS